MNVPAFLRSGSLVSIAALLLALALPAVAPATGDDSHGESADPWLLRKFTVAELAARGVKVAAAGGGDVDLGIELPGEVKPNADRIAHLAPRFAGVVREVRHQVGDNVRGGEVLAVVESDHLSRFEVVAAFDGTVIDRHVAQGEAVGPDDVAFIVADLSTVWVDLSVHQSALPFVRVGQPISLAAARGSLHAEATVGYVAPVVDQATRTASARAVLPNPDGSWRPGLYVTAIVSEPLPAAVVIPRDAVQELDGSPVVFVVDGDRFRAREITPGRKGRTLLQVAAGLEVGERYAETGTFLLKAEIAKGEGGHDE